MLATLGLFILLAAVSIPVGMHLGFRAPRTRETGSPGNYGLAFEEVRIPTVRGRHLFRWLLPAPGVIRTIVALHGWGSNAELMLPIAAPLRRGGFNVLLFDARNHGGSDSDTFSSLPRFAEDLGMAIVCPILLVHGKDDRTVPLEDAHRIHANCRASRARRLEVDGAGHDSVDKIELHIGDLLGFLDESGFTRGPGQTQDDVPALSR